MSDTISEAHPLSHTQWVCNSNSPCRKVLNPVTSANCRECNRPPREGTKAVDTFGNHMGVYVSQRRIRYDARMRYFRYDVRAWLCRASQPQPQHHQQQQQGGGGRHRAAAGHRPTSQPAATCNHRNRVDGTGNVRCGQETWRHFRSQGDVVVNTLGENVGLFHGPYDVEFHRIPRM